MLNQFYSYLCEKIIEFFKENPLKVGAKYNIQFETEDQVRKLYEALKNNNLSEEFEYRDSNNIVKYKSYALNLSDNKLIIAATIDNVSADFLTRLRNMVGVEEGYDDKGILFIHNTSLDSIMGGTEGFNKEGLPFHIDSIQKDIKNKLVSSNFNDVDKAIIELDLNRKKENIFSDSSSIFEYKELINILNSTCIEKKQYKDFGLFYDSELEQLTGKDLKKRITENADNYIKIDEIHNYGNPETQLEKYYDEKGIEKLSKENWKDIDFKDVIKSIEEKKKIIPISYIEELSCKGAWDRAEGTSKVKSRIRNIIVFNKENKDSVDIVLNFDDFLKKEFLKGDKNSETIVSGKKIKVKLYNSENTNFYKIIYKNDKNIKFEFRIVMVSFNEKYLESIKTKYSIVIKGKVKYILINTNDSNIIFNENADESFTSELTKNNEVITLAYNKKVNVRVSDDFELEDDNDLILFGLKIDNNILPLGIQGINDNRAPIEGLKVWKLKREKSRDFKYIGNNKLQHGTKEYFTRDEFRKNLECEDKLLELGGIYFKENDNGFEVIDIDIDKKVKDDYLDIIYYYQSTKKLPSLTYIDSEVINLYEKFIISYMKALNSISEGSYLSKSEKDLFNIGVIKREIEDKEIIFTPLHPMNIAYQLLLNKEVSEEELADDIIKKLTATYLLPYILDNDNKLYVPIEQYHSPEWKYYVDEKLPRYKSSRDFVTKVVSEKIEEFIGHFKYLFNMGKKAPLKINLINTGDSKEILQGVFSFYIKQLKNSKGIFDKLTPIEIFIYSDKNITNAFEEIAYNDDIEDIKETFNLNLNINNMSEEDVMNLYRDKVHFYSKKIDEGIEYSHITFLEMDNEVKTITSKMNDIPSGIMLNGLISGVPSVFLGDSYRTGFGSRFANIHNDLIKIAKKLNAVNAVIGGEPFNSEQCKAISVPNKSKEKLEEIYSNSHWVTFINPKVDLNFFKNDPDSKDLLIIHYSDQYTTAGGYDAITVTRKSIPYQRVIEEFLSKKNVNNAEKFSPKVINTFNAINGDWLLGLLSSKSNAPKEKISIISAVKLALAYFNKENIIWVPISLEEVLRISGGAGLKQNEGLFSAKNLGFDKGVTSDDILLVGIEDNSREIKVHYYPIEVKIGLNEKSYIEKGIEQAKSTKRIFRETLLPKEDKLTYTQKIYRNFLMQLVITSVEKLKLYNVYENGNWDKIINSDIRRKLLNEEYVIEHNNISDMGDAAVISFKRMASRNIKKEDDILILEFTEEDGINYLTKEINDIINLVNDNAKNDVDKNTYKRNSELIENTTINRVSVDLQKDEKCNINKTSDDFIKENTLTNTLTIDETKVQENKNIEILFGFNQNTNREVKWCPNDTNKVFHTNTGIIGTMGTGKTQFTKSMITQLYRETKYNVDRKDIGILIFDYKGDYNQTKKDFIEATNAKIFRLCHLPFNPLSIIRTENSKPMLPLHTASGLKETLAKAFGLGVIQESLLKDLIMEAYERRGISKVDEDTWDNIAPTLKDVYDIYIEKEDIKKGDSLYAALSNLIDFEIFEPDPKKTTSLFELINDVTVIDLSGYDTGIQNLVVAITLDLFYTQMQSYGHSKIEGNLRQLNKMILVDEADNFLSKNFSSLKKILKEGREFGVGTILSTQLLSHFSTGENDYANYILTWVVHNVADLNNKDVRYIFNTKNKAEDEEIYNSIKSLDKHFSLVKMGDNNKPIYMKDKAFWELIK